MGNAEPNSTENKPIKKEKLSSSGKIALFII